MSPSNTSGSISPGRRRLLVGALLTAWAFGTCLAFWLLEGQYFRPVARPAGAAVADPASNPTPPIAVLASDAGLVTLNEHEPVTVLNFWNAGCPCSRFMESHVQALINHYRPRGVRFVTIVEASAGTSTESAMSAWRDRRMPSMPAVADTGGAIARRFGVWAAPAAVIVDGVGKIRFVGAYNAARYCDNPSSAWAEQALAQVVHNRRPALARTAFFGCQVLGRTKFCANRP